VINVLHTLLCTYLCSIKYIYKISFPYRVLLTVTQKAYQNK